MRKNGCDLSDPRIAMLDLQYHDIDRSRGIYYLLERQGKMRRVAADAAIAHAMDHAPRDTRAHIRGQFIRFAKESNRPYSVDWTYLKLSGYFEETILCTNPFVSRDPRVDELVSTVAGDQYNI